MKVLVTGSSGLIGSEAVKYFCGRGYSVHGIDNNMRKIFFGEKGDTTWNLDQLKLTMKSFTHFNIDIRDREKILELFRVQRYEAIVHCAAQPSHDKAKEIPFIDFEVNAVATLNLLEAARQFSPESPFVLMSTNKVYGDAPNEIPLRELETRWDYADSKDWDGINENLRIDRSTHSLFGVSKLAGDVLAQEYGRYFDMPVGVFRGGCLTGPSHSGVELHGFLNYLVKVAVNKEKYTIFGYKGKQVRDQIHSYDVITAFDFFIQNPRKGEVYNLGGGRDNAASMMELITELQTRLGYKMDTTYSEINRVGDHICYISDLGKFKSHYPNWKITKNLSTIINEILEQSIKNQKN